jgi:NADPH:quinone reductase-like Zn-dependent oxidoreductase
VAESFAAPEPGGPARRAIVQIDAEVPLAEAPEAIAGARAGHARGKTVIIP